MDSLELLDALAERDRSARAAADEARDALREHIAATSPTAPEPVPDPITDYAVAKRTGISISTVRTWRGKRNRAAKSA